MAAEADKGEVLMRNIWCILVACLFLCCVGSVSATDMPKVDRDMLPMLFMQYAFDLAHAGSTVKSPAVGETNVLVDIQKSFEMSLEKLGVDIPVKLGFVRQAFIVQPDVTGNRYVGRRGVSTLYVTTPIHSFQDRVIVVISSTSPEATTVIAMDDQLRAKLIYDSVFENRFSGKYACDPMGQVTSIRISQTGVLNFQESNVHWSNKRSRSFTLDMNVSNPEMQCAN